MSGEAKFDRPGLVKNTIPEHDTGYIKKEKLEAKLRDLFGCPIEVRVHVCHCSIIHMPTCDFVILIVMIW